MLYAKNKWLRRGPFLEVGTPVMHPFVSACWRRELSASTQRRKRYGDKESPCLIPWHGTILPIGCPFTTIAYKTVPRHVITRLTYWLEKPNLCIITYRNVHSNLSYALLVSSLSPMYLTLPYSRDYMEWRVSYAAKMLSEISLLGIKTLSFGEMIWEAPP
jgi:hypothetical protein